MIDVSLDAAPGQEACCLAKKYPERNITLGFLLFGFGTRAAPDSVLQNGVSRSLTMGTERIRASMDTIAASAQYGDPLSCASRLHETLCGVNQQLKALQAISGQGLYIGGVVTYFYESNYVLIPFGGGSAHTWDGTTLRRQGASAFAPEQDGLIRDALGGASHWPGTCWQGTLHPGRQLICITGEPEPASFQKMLENENAPCDDSTTALLCGEQLKRTPLPVAVLRFRNREE